MQDPRKYRHNFTLKLADLDKLDTVRADLRAFLESHPNVDRSQPLSVDLTNFSGSNFDIGIEVMACDRVGSKDDGAGMGTQHVVA